MKKPRAPRSDAAALRRQAEARIGGESKPADQHTEHESQRLVHELQVHQIELELQNEELREARVALEEALDGYTELYDYSTAGYLTVNPRGEIVAMNLTAAKMLGLPRTQLLARRLASSLELSCRGPFDLFIAKQFRSELNDGCDVTVRREGAPSLVLHVTGGLSNNRETCQLVAVDITERKNLDLRRIRSEAKYRTLFETSLDAVLLLDSKGIVDFNPATMHAFGATAAAQLRGLRFEDLSAPKPRDGTDASTANRSIAEALASGSCRFEWAHRRFDSSETFTADVLLSRLVLEGEEVVQATVRDTTERKRLLALAATAERLTTLGIIAGGIAHEVNNPLAYVLLNLEIVARDLVVLSAAAARCAAALRSNVGDQAFQAIAGDAQLLLEPAALAEMNQSLDEALAGTRRIRDVASGLRTFSKVEPGRRVAVDLRAAIESALTMASNETSSRAKVITQFADDLPKIMASDGTLTELFLNLLINAAHSITQGDRENQTIRLRTFREGEWVCAEVVDSGRGISAQDLPHAFEPFWSPHSMVKGSTLELAICRNIALECGGDISVTSTERGSCFTLRFPPAVSTPVSNPRQVGQPVRGRVLVIDDEANLRTSVRRTLGRAHEVVLAESGAQAKALFEAGERFDVILCDLMMPGMTGTELHAWLVSFDRTLAERVVFVTGGAFTPETTEYLASVDNLQIDKPFDPEAFSQTVASRVAALRG